MCLSLSSILLITLCLSLCLLFYPSPVFLYFLCLFLLKSSLSVFLSLFSNPICISHSTFLSACPSVPSFSLCSSVSLYKTFSQFPPVILYFLCFFLPLSACLFLSLSISFYLFLSLSISFYLFLSLSISLFSLSPSVSLSLFSLSLFPSFSICLSLSQSNLRHSSES